MHLFENFVCDIAAILYRPTAIDWLLLRALQSARPTKGISIEFEILSKLGVLQFTICLTDHNEILRTWSVVHI